MQSPRRTIDIRSANRQTVLRQLYFEGTMSRLELSQRAQLSPTTITNVMTELLKENLVIETGLEASEGGRPRTILAVNPRYGTFVGVDLGETHVQLDLFDMTLRKQNSVRYLVSPRDNAPEKYVDMVARGLDALFPAGEYAREQVLGIGIGLPGLVERGGAQRVSSPIWKWQNVAFEDLLKTRVALPVLLDNGAKALTLAEAWFGAGRGHQNLIAVLIGTGIGSGIITQGSLYRGPTNSAGEFGHTTIVLDGRPCRCGSSGCLEAYAGGPGIVATLRALAPDSPLLDAGREPLAQLNAIVDAAAQGDTAAAQTLHETAHYLGAALANLVNLFNPEKIVLGGWVGLQIGRTIMPELRAFLEHYALPLSRNVVQLDLCQLGDDAICIGAAGLVLEQFLSGDARFVRREAG